MPARSMRSCVVRAMSSPPVSSCSSRPASRVGSPDMSVWHLRGIVLPEAEERDVYVVDDRLSLEHVAGAETVHDGGFLLPGLVDTHCHPGTAAIGEPLDEKQLRQQGEELTSQGVSLVRVPGGAGRLRAWFGVDRGMTRSQSDPTSVGEGRRVGGRERG